MIIGVPKEIKDNEYRVALTPAGAEALIVAGHTVLIQAGAGEGSGFTDQEYAGIGTKILPTATEVWGQAEMIMKVKEPLRPEYGYLREGLLLFTYLHLAAEEHLTRELIERRVSAIAYETVQLADGRLPLLTPMSEVAGRMAVQIGAHYLERMNGGRGKLLGGVPGVRPCEVVILGGGIVGTNAAQIALGMGADATIFDVNLDRLRYLSEVLHGHLTTMASSRRTIATAVQTADLVIGSVLVPGAKAPKLLTAEMVRSMQPGSVIIDVAVDQGGCVETSHPTSHSHPTYLVDGVLHYCVPNMPGAVPRTSTLALGNATMPYALRLANQGFARAVSTTPELAKGVNTYAGAVTYPAVAEAFGLKFVPLQVLLESAGGVSSV